MTTRRLTTTCLVGACLLLAIGLWLMLDNQSVDISASDLGDGRPAGEVMCTIAPYDAGFNGNDEGPGGQHSRGYFDEVGSECYSVSMTRFKAAVASWALALVSFGGAAVAAVRSSTRFRAGR